MQPTRIRPTISAKMSFPAASAAIASSHTIFATQREKRALLAGRGTLDAYYDANMDLVSVTPEFNLYDERWPIRTRLVQQPPAKFVFAQEGRRMGVAIDSIVSPGCIVSGGRVTHSVLSPGVRVNSYCEVEGSILLSNAQVGRYSRIRRAIIDANVHIPESSVIGFDPEEDSRNGHHISESGIVVVSDKFLTSRKLSVPRNRPAASVRPSHAATSTACATCCSSVWISSISNGRSMTKIRALHVAVMRRDPAIVRLLMQHGAIAGAESGLIVMPPARSRARL